MSGSLLRDGAAFDPVSGKWTPMADSPALVVFPTTAVLGSMLYVLTGSGIEGAPPTFLADDTTTDTWTTLPLPPDGTGRLVAADDVLLSVPGSDEFGQRSTRGSTPHCPRDQRRGTQHQVRAMPTRRTSVAAIRLIRLSASRPRARCRPEAG